jgi:hypothetical protein
MEAPQTYVFSRPQWGKLLHASHAGGGQKITYDEDAEYELHALLLLLSQSVGVRIGES